MIIMVIYTLILLFTDRGAAGALCIQALKQWYETMIPALFPTMLISSILVDTGFAQKIGNLLNRTLLRFLHISGSGCYCLLTGFLFGFPMGAKTTSDMIAKKELSYREAEYLLSFINCLGPMYVLNLVHKLFPMHDVWKLLLGIYGLPLIYGFFLRYTIYQKEIWVKKDFHHRAAANNMSNEKVCYNASLVDALYECVPKCGRSMLMLGGYMVLFQVSFLTMKHFLNSINMVTDKLYPLLEVTGGFFLLPQGTSLSWVLFYTTFGGACCFLQTYSFLKPAGLSIRSYILHKSILATAAFLLGLLL